MNGQQNMILHTTGYSARKRNEVQIHTITWKNFKNIMLGERSHALKERYYTVPAAIRNVEKIKSSKTESKLMFAED